MWGMSEKELAIMFLEILSNTGKCTKKRRGRYKWLTSI